MSVDPMEAAAKAIADKWLEKVDDHTVRVGPPVIARAALLAFLDPEDDDLALVVGADVSDAVFDGEDYDVEMSRKIGRAAIGALRKLAGEQT